MALFSLLAEAFPALDLQSTFQKAKEGTRDVVSANWNLGLTAFGGPPVHFQIFRRKFLDHLKWIDEQTYQELFAISSSLPGPASTKMLFNINIIRGGFFNGVLAFLLWSLPGAVGMFGLSLGVSRIGDTLPAAVFALLTGLNAAVVGVIALAAVQLSEKVITDKLTRILVFLGGACGMLYTALWYFPVLMAAAAIITIIWDLKILQNMLRAFKPRQVDDTVELGELPPSNNIPNISRPVVGNITNRHTSIRSHVPSSRRGSNVSDSPTPSPPRSSLLPTWRQGVATLLTFLAIFLTIMLLRGLYHSPPRIFSLFANMFLAGTIIFGGGPVVIPLLREYVVAQGWVSSRDFLIGLALIQAFPGPNFNFAVYLGSLAVASAAGNSGGRSTTMALAGATVAFLGIFAPGLVVQTGFMGLWGAVRKNRALDSALRGVNAAAVGLVFTAVYRIWQSGFLDREHQSGQPLGSSPWWVAVTATSFVGGRWFGLNPLGAVVLGSVMGLIWYGVVQA